MTLATLIPDEEPADEITMMHRLDITFTQAVILKTIWKSGVRGTNAFPGKRASRQHIYNMRPKLSKHGIFIVNLGYGRYGMPQSSRDALDRMF